MKKNRLNSRSVAIVIFFAVSMMFIACKKENNTKPKADFTVTATNNWQAPCRLTFTSTSTDATSCNWSSDFIDFDNNQTFTGFSVNIEQARTGTVTLTASNAYGTDEITKTLTVYAGSKPKADFEITATNGWYAPCTVTFNNKSTGATNYRWTSPNIDFGNNHDLESFYIICQTAGTKTVTLTASNAYGTDEITKTLTVLEDPNRSGYLKMVSQSNNPYNIYINGIFQREISGGGSYTFELTPSTYQVRVLQVSGYLIYPTDETYSITIKSDVTTTKNFPE